MGKTKNMHYFSVANMDLRQMGGSESHIVSRVFGALRPTSECSSQWSGQEENQDTAR